MFETIFFYIPTIFLSYKSKMILFMAVKFIKHQERTLDFLLSFLIGFIGIWFVSNVIVSKPTSCKYKDPMVDIAKMYGYNKKISKELKMYSLDQIKNGNYEYAEVIDTIKRRENDKTGT